MAAYDSNNHVHYSIIHLRMPRFVQVFCTGGLLAVSGYLMQSLVNNPLADPYLLGTSGGASLGASLAISFISDISWLATTFFSFAGALGITAITILIAYNNRSIYPGKLLLGGVAMSSLTVSAMSLTIYLSKNEHILKSILYWSFGNFEYANWNFAITLLSISIIAIPMYGMLTKELTLLLMGENRAQNLGLNIMRTRWIVLSGVCIMVGSTVACSGPIGFAGLIIPHVVRVLHGVAGRYNILHCFFVGGIFLSLCDIGSRILYAPAGLPIGIVTSVIGIPFFLYLLSKNTYRI
jgi:iron complex transport system permease protein